MNKLLYSGIGLLAFVVFLVTMAPASVAVAIARKHIDLPGLVIGSVEGSVWRGVMEVQYRRFPVTTLTWRLSALPLVIGDARASVLVEAEGLDASFNSTLSFGGVEITNANATIESSYINQVTVTYGLDLSQRLRLQDAAAAFDGQGFARATGRMDWPGGMVHIQTPQQLHSVNLPPLSAALSSNEGRLSLLVKADDADLMTIGIKPDGWAEVAVFRALPLLAGLPLPTGSGDEPALLLEEKIL